MSNFKKKHTSTQFGQPQPVVRRTQPPQQPVTDTQQYSQTVQPTITTPPSNPSAAPRVVTNFPAPGLAVTKPSRKARISLKAVGALLFLGTVSIGAVAIGSPKTVYEVRAALSSTDSQCQNADGKFHKNLTATLSKGMFGVPQLSICINGLVVSPDTKLRVQNIPAGDYLLYSAAPRQNTQVAAKDVVTAQVTYKEQVVPVKDNKFVINNKEYSIQTGSNKVNIEGTEATVQTVDSYTVQNGVNYPVTKFDQGYTASLPVKWGYVFGYVRDDGTVVRDLKSVISQIEAGKTLEELGLKSDQFLTIVPSPKSTSATDLSDRNLVQVYPGGDTDKYILGAKDDKGKPLPEKDAAKILNGVKFTVHDLK